MGDNNICWWILLGLDCLIYGLCCIMIIKRKNYTSISIRSPTLLLSTILSNFFMKIIIDLYKLFKRNEISSFYYIFRLMMVLSVILRYERILICCNINSLKREEEEFNRKQYKEKKYLYHEKFYVRLLLIAFALFLISMVVIKIVKIKGVAFFYTFNYIYNFKDAQPYNSQLFKSQMMGWVIWNFIEQLFLISYLFRVLLKSIKEKIKTELLSFFILWYIYSLICTFINYITKKKELDEDEMNLIVIIMSLCVHYIGLFINGYFPLFLSFHYKTAISYHFSPKLMNNLFLFLTNEECYDSFSDYLTKTNSIKSLFYLQLYTHIMKYKLSFVLNVNKDIGLNDANEIYNTYFRENSQYENQIDINVIKKVRSDCKILENNTFTSELFDEALQFVFNELNKKYVVFHNTEEFNRLYKKIKLESYIQCKMCNTGLINKY